MVLLIVLLEYLYMENILADEYLVCYLGDFKLAILIEDDDVIKRSKNWILPI